MAGMHQECLFRSIAGPVAHIEHRCGCFIPGSSEGDPPGMTVREAARAALEAFERLDGLKPGALERRTAAYNRWCAQVARLN